MPAWRRLHAFARARQSPLLAAAREIADTDELPPKARKALAELAANFARWSETARVLPHTELAEMVLDESGYTDMLKADKSAEAPGRLDNLKEFVRSMESFESLAAFLEHVSLVMEIAQDESGDRINLMTLHAAKGLEFDTVFLPGWEEGLFPSQRTMDENGLAGLEEERRLAYVGLTRAKQRGAHFLRRQPPGAWHLAERAALALPQRNSRRAMSIPWWMKAFTAAPPAFATMPAARLSPAPMNRRAGNAPRPTAPPPQARTRPPLIEAQAYARADHRSRPPRNMRAATASSTRNSAMAG